MMLQCSTQATSSRVYQHCTVVMMHECSTHELLTRAAFIHHDDTGYCVLNDYIALKGLSDITDAQMWRYQHVRQGLVLPDSTGLHEPGILSDAAGGRPDSSLTLWWIYLFFMPCL